MNPPAERPAPADAAFISHFISAQDGVKLHVREYGGSTNARLAVVCLPGLSRNSADFDVLSMELVRTRQRRVLALDYRGRGRSEHDPNPGNYNPAVEAGDVMAALTALQVDAAVFVATSRGGILTMLLATVRPSLIRGVVLNDIGPVIDPAGLLRIKSYVGKLPAVNSYDEAADHLQSLSGFQFPLLTREHWLTQAQRSFYESKGRLQPAYDIALARTLDGVPPDGVLPPLWNQFEALAAHPLLVIRGSNSDILSPATVHAMQARRKDMEILEVRDQGHPPSLDGKETIEQIAAFIARCELRHKHCTSERLANAMRPRL